MNNKASSRWKYLVTYSVASMETYRNFAGSGEEADELAYIDGEFVETGDSVRINQLEIREAPAA